MGGRGRPFHSALAIKCSGNRFFTPSAYECATIAFASYSSAAEPTEEGEAREEKCVAAALGIADYAVMFGVAKRK